MGAHPNGFARSSSLVTSLRCAAPTQTTPEYRSCLSPQPGFPIDVPHVHNAAGNRPACRSGKRSVPRHPQQEVKRWQNR
jgi:hypothetical protein